MNLPPTNDPPEKSLPLLADLRSVDARVSESAWQAAYPHLWKAAISLLAGNLLVGPEHLHDREDIAAKAISEAVQGLIEGKSASFNQMSTFDDVVGMTRQIVRARTVDFFRRRGRHPEDPTENLPEPVNETGAAESRLTREEFDALITRLKPPQPEIFRLHFVDGHTAQEIADDIKMPRGTVLSHLFRGMKMLRPYLENLAGGDASGVTLNSPST